MSITYRLRRLAKIEAPILERKCKEARRYNKAYPGCYCMLDAKSACDNSDTVSGEK
jgi:hypothetical protein